jgi:hypothetical protein
MNEQIQTPKGTPLFDRAGLARQRAAITVPPPGALGSMRQLANELAAARGAVDVGLVVTVTPTSRLDLRVRKDGEEVEVASDRQPVDIEARAKVELSIGDCPGGAAARSAKRLSVLLSWASRRSSEGDLA